MPDIEIKEQIIYEKGHYAEPTGWQEVKQTLVTQINLPSKSGTYQTVLGEISIDMSGIDGESDEQRLKLKGDIFGGLCVAIFRYGSGDDYLQLGKHKSMRIYERTAKRPAPSYEGRNYI